MASERISHAQLVDALNYDPETGVFTWRVARGRHGNIRAGTVAGTVDDKGYVRITIFGRKYRAHQLAIYHATGKWPEDEVDHRDTVKHHNWSDNIRPATHAENRQNLRKPYANNKAKLLGVSFYAKTAKWRAQIQVGGKVTHIGYFKTKEDAHAAYVAKKREIHPRSTL